MPADHFAHESAIARIAQSHFSRSRKTVTAKHRASRTNAAVPPRPIDRVLPICEAIQGPQRIDEVLRCRVFVLFDLVDFQ